MPVRFSLPEEEKRLLRIRMAWECYIMRGDTQDTERELDKALHQADRLIVMEDQMYLREGFWSLW